MKNKYNNRTESTEMLRLISVDDSLLPPSFQLLTVAIGRISFAEGIHLSAIKSLTLIFGMFA